MTTDTTTRPTALLLDVDGTLLDTVYLHVLASGGSAAGVAHTEALGSAVGATRC